MKYATDPASPASGDKSICSPLSPRSIDYILVPVLYFLGAKLGTLTVMPEGMAIVWPPNSVLLAALLIFQGRGFLPFALLTIAAEVIADVPTFSLTEALLFGLVNVTEASIVFALLTRWRFDPRFSALSDLSKFVAAGPFIGALTCAFFGAWIYSHFRGTETTYFEFLRVWWFGDALGLMIFTPLWLSLWRSSFAGDSPKVTCGSTDWAVLAATIAVIAVLAFADDGVLYGMHTSPVFLLPFVIYAAARFDFRVVAVAVAVAALATVVLTTSGRNPFGDLPPRDTVIQAQEFIFILSLMSLGLAALLSQLRAQQRELQSTNQRLGELNQQLEQRVSERTAQLAAANEQLSRLAMTDALTGLLNRRAFFEIAHREIERCRRHHRPLSLMMLDLDHFKTINDRYGHQVGDLVLQQMVTIVKEAVRAGDVFARYGGEEFVILAPDADLDAAVALAQRIREALGARGLHVLGQDIDVTASLGVAALADQIEGLDTLLSHADRALYEAKSAGRNRVMRWTPCSAP